MGLCLRCPHDLTPWIDALLSYVGLHNSMRNDLRGTRNFLIFLFFYALFGTGVSIITMNTIYFYCASAETYEVRPRCPVSVTSHLPHALIHS